MTTLGFRESLEGFTELRKTVRLTGRTYYSKQLAIIQVKVSRVKGAWDGVVGTPGGRVPLSFPVGQCGRCFVSQSTGARHHVPSVSPRGTHPSLDVQGFYCGSIREACSVPAADLRNLSPVPPEVTLIPPRSRPPPPAVLLTQTAWRGPRPGTHRDSPQTGKSRAFTG